MLFSRVLCAGMAAAAFAYAPAAPAASAPDWMEAQVNVPVPAHDEETNAVLLYSETELVVQAPGKMKRIERQVYKILRRNGASYGDVRTYFSPQNRITSIRGWSIPPQGKAFAVKERDAVDSALVDIDGGELMIDVRQKLLKIPAADPGSIVGYEIERETQPYEMTDEWDFQDTVPVREARYTVRLPPGWSYRVFWLNRGQVEPTQLASGQWRWIVTDIAPVKLERQMPPWRGVAARMVLSLQPPGGQGGGFQSWQDVGSWYLGLADGRRDPSPQLRQKVQELTASEPDMLRKVQALAAFVQKDVRYVAIELGIGSVQPHPAAEVFAHRYGDCKDKVTLLSSMLKEIGVESHYVLINTSRGSITSTTPPNIGFNHVILAIQLPASIDGARFPALIRHETLGAVLFFDPTHPLIPLGALPGALQANFGLLVTPSGGELLGLPQAASELSGVQRTAKLTLDANGALRGVVQETWTGDGAAAQRYSLRTARQDVDQIKSVESMLAHSLSKFRILRASVGNLSTVERPLLWSYEVEIEHYTRSAGELMIVRPRVWGALSSDLLETKEARQHPIEFAEPVRNTDVFEITVPAGYSPDSLPPPTNEDLGAISYRSSTTFTGQVLRYTRTLEVKDLALPASKAEALKQFFRKIEADERSSAVLKKG